MCVFGTGGGGGCLCRGGGAWIGASEHLVQHSCAACGVSMCVSEDISLAEPRYPS